MERGKAPHGQEIADRELILMSANSFWNIRNFRSGLVQTLIGEGWRVVLASPDADRQWAAERGADVIDIRLDRSGTNPLRDSLLILAYHRLMRKFRPNYFIGFTAKPNIYGSIAARVAGVRSLPNISGLGTAFINPGPLSTVVGILYRLALSRCPIVFFQNADDRDLFVRRRIVRLHQTRLLPGSGVDLDRFRPDGGPPPAAICFLFVGRILRDKGVREFVEAARQLRLRHPDWRFCLLGPIDEGNRSGISEAELASWVKEEVVEYLGQAADVRPHLASSTAVVLPSYREGLPRSLLEAAAMARPLIATDVPGNRQIVEHGINGLLCEARSHASLADAMETVGLMDPERREAMGNHGRSKVEREFSEQRVFEAYLDAIEQLQAGGRS